MLVQASAESLPADTTQDFRKGGRGLGFSVYGGQGALGSSKRGYSGA